MSPVLLLLAMSHLVLAVDEKEPLGSSVLLVPGLLAFLDQFADALAAFLAELLVTLVAQFVLACLSALAAGFADGHVALVVGLFGHGCLLVSRATRSRRSPSSRLAGRRSCPREACGWSASPRRGRHCGARPR